MRAHQMAAAVSPERRLRPSMQEIASRDAIDVRKPAIGIGLEIEARDEIEQAAIRAVCDCDWQRLFVEGRDIAAGETVQQRIQTPLRGFARAQELEFFLEVAEGSQAVMLLRKPGMQVVHAGLFGVVEEAADL